MCVCGVSVCLQRQIFPQIHTHVPERGSRSSLCMCVLCVCVCVYQYVYVVFEHMLRTHSGDSEREREIGAQCPSVASCLRASCLVSHSLTHTSIRRERERERERVRITRGPGTHDHRSLLSAAVAAVTARALGSRMSVPISVSLSLSVSVVCVFEMREQKFFATSFDVSLSSDPVASICVCVCVCV